MPNNPKCPCCDSAEFVEQKSIAENIGVLTGAGSGVAAAGVGTKSGMIVGATLGSVVPGGGTVVGAGIGAFVGAASGAFVGKEVGKKIDKWRGKYYCKKCNKAFEV